MKCLIFTISFGLLIISSKAQTVSLELVSSVGDIFKITSYQLDWSIGELQTETYAQTGQILTQGFHQSNYTVTALEQLNGLQFEISAFPNPTMDLINLKIGISKIDGLQYIIADISGNIFQKENITSSNQQIDFSNYSNGVYFITVLQNRKSCKSFKIIKN
jgi:hypothetical protein